MSQKSTSYRKTASSFVNDQSNINLMQVSPRAEPFHLEQRSPYTMTNYASKTNFIGDSLHLPEGPRAVSVSESGEKHLIELDDDVIKANSNSNPFTSHSPSYTTTHHFSTSTMPKILEQSSSQLRLSETEESFQNQGDINSQTTVKYAKRSKNSRRHANPKYRINCTPRNNEKISSTCISSAYIKPCKLAKPQEKTLPAPLTPPPPHTLQSIKKNTSTETQTDYVPFTSTNLNMPRKCNSTTDRAMQMTMINSKNHFSDLTLNELIASPQILTQKHLSTPLQPTLKIYTKTNPNLKKYSELRGIASALTLITVITWLFSIFFELDSLSHYFDKVVECFQNWFSTQEKPKTKAELVIKFVQDLWT